MDKSGLYSSSSKEPNYHIYDAIKAGSKRDKPVSSQSPEEKKLATPSSEAASPLHGQDTPAASSRESENSILSHDIKEPLLRSNSSGSEIDIQEDKADRLTNKLVRMSKNLQAFSDLKCTLRNWNNALPEEYHFASKESTDNKKIDIYDGVRKTR